MISIKLIVRKNRTALNGYPIVLYININGIRLNFYTNIYLDNPEYLINGKVIRKDKLHIEKNAKLAKIISYTNTILLKENNVETIKESIYNHIHGIIKKDKKLIDYIKEFMSLKNHKRTASLYQNTINKIKSYDANIKIEDVDKKWLISFENYCSKSMSINGCAVYMRNIRAVFNYFLEEGKITNYPFKAYSIKKEDTIHRALSIEDLRKLRAYKGKPFVTKYIDVFILMIYLIGINPKDLLYLSNESLRESRIEYHRFKTGKLYSIKVEPEALEIINKYKGKSHLLIFIEKNKDYLGFVRSLARRLNKVCKDIDIQPVTAYWARHTWASIAFEIGIPKDIISLALGHSTGVKVTDIYIKYDLIKVDEANRKVIDYITKQKAP